jgi:halocyanin-like protein
MISKQRDSTHAAESPTRRRFLYTAGGVAVAGLFAGCTDNGSSGNTGADDGSEGASVDEWLADTDNYDGSVTDMTGKTSVTVKVGPENNEYVFAPAAIRITPGTMVTWQWIGSGYHNVVARNGQFKSGEPAQNATFEHTFETAGTNLYYCEPHKSMGMKGAVIVAGSDTTSPGNTATQEAQ